MSLSCALLATSLHQWARRYLRLAQPARCSPEKRARMRAFFANGVEKMHVPWAVEGLPTLLHLSLFLFFGGLAIFLFNIDQQVFISVVWWIGLFSMVYGLITLLPIIRHDGPYNSPLSAPAWFLYASIYHLTFKFLALIKPGRFWSYHTWKRCEDLRERYQRWMLGGVEKAAEETVSEQSSEVDDQIMDWTISALGDDNSLKSFFQAIPGFFNSTLVKHLKRDFPVELILKFRDALNGFLGRTWTSNSVDNLEKVRRLDIAMNAVILIRHSNALVILQDNLFKHWNDVPQTVEMGYTLARWCTSSNQSVSQGAQAIIARILVNVRQRNDGWVTLATRLFGIPEQDLSGNISLGGDSVLLAIFIHVTRQYLRSDYANCVVLEELSKLDIWNTHPRLQHDFCTLWNKIVQEARNRGRCTVPVYILRQTRHLYITLHQGTNAAPTAFSAFTDYLDQILWQPSSYSFCNLASHCPDSIAQFPIPNSCQVPLPTGTPPCNSPDALSSSPIYTSAVPQRAKQTNIIAGLPAPSNPTTANEIRDSCQRELTNPVHSSPCLTGDVAATKQAITPTATLSHPLEGSEKQDLDVVPPSAQPGTSKILSTASPHTPTLTPAPILTSLPNTMSECYDGVASFSNSCRSDNSSHLAPPSIGSSTLALRTTAIATLPRLGARGLVNTRDICFADALLKLLVNSPPFWDLFRELGDLKGQRGAGLPETGGGAAPLMDATERFLRDFVVEEESLSTRQQSQPATGGTVKVDEEEEGDNVVDLFSLEPTYMHDAMRQLKPLLVRSYAPTAFLLLICAGVMCVGWPTARFGRVLPSLY